MYDFYDVNLFSSKYVDKPIQKTEWINELNRRIDIEKNRKTICANYYRIGVQKTFDLPIKRGWQNSFLINYENIKPYPWDIWLMWELRERWDTLFASYVLYKDEISLNILIHELDEALKWDAYSIGYKAYLGTAHFAMCVYRYLHRNIFPKEIETKFRKSSKSFLDSFFFQWFEDFKNIDKSNTENFVHNIWVMMVFAGLSLAKEIKHPKVIEIQEIADEMIEILSKGKNDEYMITEMASYDAFYLSTITEYLKDFIGNYFVLKDNIIDALHSFIDTSVPGRGDILAPIGDVEQEMQFHSLVLIRCHKLLSGDEGACAICKTPVKRLMALSLFELIESDLFAPKEFEYTNYVRKNAGTIVMRNGKENDEILCAVSIAKWKCGHVHNDNGSFVFASHGLVIISDPGYQQYISGDERVFDIGTYAHNCPIINGKKQSYLNAQLLEYDDNHIILDLTRCYDLPNCSKVIRKLSYNENDKMLTIEDSFYNLDGSKIEHSFTFEKYFNVSIKNGVVLLNSEVIKAKMYSSNPFEPNELSIPNGSKGKKRIIHSQTIGKEEKIIYRIKVS